MNRPQHAAVRSLTSLYCLHQAAYYFAIGGLGAFAVTYLTSRGFSSSVVGVILATTNILSFLLQPVIGSHADKTSIVWLQKILPRFILIAFASLAAVEFLTLPQALTAFLYIAGYLAFSITTPLYNPLCAYYSQHGHHINYGAGAGVGSLAFSFASLTFGFIIARLGTRAMMLVVFAFLVLLLVFMLRYPKIKPEKAASSLSQQKSLSMFAFAKRYKWFMVTMLGVICLAACHAMAENFMIHQFSCIGGGSENVGIALFLACTMAAPVSLFFERIQRHISIVLLMRLSGFFYILKAVLFIYASSIVSIYLIELLQVCTYAFLYPSLYYLVIRRIQPEDMAKGQTLASSMFTLGMALGNSLGGIAIEHFGLEMMFALAACIAGIGTLLVNLCVAKKDAPV